MTGYLTILRLLFRLDRIKLPMWLLGLGLLVGITPTSVRSLTETEAATRGVAPEVILAEQAVLVETNAAMVAMSGPADSLDTFGGRYAFEISAFTFALVGLMSALLVIRHTRAEEEAGRVELTRALGVGPWARIGAVITEALVANVAVAAVILATFLADGIDPARTLLFASGMALCGLAFAAVTLVVVQVFEFGKGAVGGAMSVLAFAYVIRAAGDVRDDWLVVLSPIGLAQHLDPYGAARWWPLVVLGALVVAGVAGAAALSRRRDVGAGLIGQRPGPARAADSLVSPIGLVWRLQRQTLVWWAVGIAGFGAVWGSMLSSLDDFVADNETMGDMLDAMGISSDSIREGFASMALTLLAMMAMAAALQVVVRVRTEEREGRAEAVLGTAASRQRWFGAFVVVAQVAAPLLLLAAVVGTYGADAAVTGEVTGLADGVWGALARVPAVLAVTGVAVLLAGWSGRTAAAGWFAFGASAVLFLFGELLQLPMVVQQLSPLPHVTHLPYEAQPWLSLVVLTTIGLAGTVAGVALFERRDVG